MLKRFFSKFSFFKKSNMKIKLNNDLLPEHIAIIMDGNGRWAKQKGLPRSLGHRAGVEALRKVIEACLELKIKYLTVYAFSTENWKRPKEEVNSLMNLLAEYLHKELTNLNKNNVRINILGDTTVLPNNIQLEIQNSVVLTKNNNKLVLSIALNYGGRAEIIDAVKKIATNVKKKEIDIEDINEELLGKNLYTHDLPDPDFLLRPSGEFRISNFLLWQIAYTELYITETFWPDFNKDHLYKALEDYATRNRRFGGIK